MLVCFALLQHRYGVRCLRGFHGETRKGKQEKTDLMDSEYYSGLWVISRWIVRQTLFHVTSWEFIEESLGWVRLGYGIRIDALRCNPCKINRRNRIHIYAYLWSNNDLAVEVKPYLQQNKPLVKSVHCRSSCLSVRPLFCMGISRCICLYGILYPNTPTLEIHKTFHISSSELPVFHLFLIWLQHVDG